MTDTSFACDGLTAGGWKVVPRRSARVAESIRCRLKLTDVAGGGEALVAAIFGGYPRVAHESSQVGGWPIPHPTVLRFNRLSRQKQVYMSRRLTAIGQRSQHGPQQRPCVYVGRKGNLSERCTAHSLALELSPQIWICHTCLHT